MKKLIALITIVLPLLVSCGPSEKEKEEEKAKEQLIESIKEVEAVTDEIKQETENLQNEVESAVNEIDSLLQDI
jgi:peptidoglycan hydrolase CwlO-like protein